MVRSLADVVTDVPPDVWDRLPVPVIYVVGVGIIVTLAIIRLGEAVAASETIAKSLGRPGKWWRRRIQQRNAKAKEARLAEMREVFRTPEAKVLQDRIDMLERMVRILADETHTTMDNREMDAAYLREDAEWHTRASILAAEQGFKMPRHRNYTQFCREWRIAHGHRQPKGDDKAKGS